MSKRNYILDALDYLSADPPPDYECCGEPIPPGSGYQECRECHIRMCLDCALEGLCPACWEAAKEGAEHEAL